MITKIPGLQAGWNVLELHQSTLHPRDAVVLCERETPQEKHKNFVTWSVNMIEGGCFCGNYWDSYNEARKDYGVRKANLR
jgi:hypothetical protein